VMWDEVVLLPLTWDVADWSAVDRLLPLAPVLAVDWTVEFDDAAELVVVVLELELELLEPPEPLVVVVVLPVGELPEVVTADTEVPLVFAPLEVTW
jgi:TRAP-type C4-dicarboxylate transport system permease large subunit